MNCKECQYWVPGLTALAGKCHRYPPPGDGWTTSHPTTAFNDWCGEYREKENKSGDNDNGKTQRGYKRKEC